MENLGFDSKEPIKCVSPLDNKYTLFTTFPGVFCQDVVFWLYEDKNTFYQCVFINGENKIVEFSPITGKYKFHSVEKWCQEYLESDSVERIESSTGHSSSNMTLPLKCMCFSFFLVETAFPFMRIFSVDETRIKRSAAERKIGIDSNRNGGLTFHGTPKLDRIEKPFKNEMIVYRNDVKGSSSHYDFNIIDIMARTFGSVYLPDEAPVLSSVPQNGSYIVLGDSE
jgi:hypothetical protein